MLPIPKTGPSTKPDLVQISFRSFNEATCNGLNLKSYSIIVFSQASNEQEMEDSSKQIPVISDIERIKRIIEIIEFVGDKVGAIVDNLPAPSAGSVSTAERRIARNDTDKIDNDSGAATEEPVGKAP